MRQLLTPLAVLVRPRATFERLRERRGWVWVFALLAVLLTLVVKLAVDTPHVLEMQAEVMREANAGVTFTSDESEGGIRTPGDSARSGEEPAADEEVVIPEDVQGTVETLTVVASYVFGSLGVVLGALLLAGVVYGVTRLWSSEAPFALVLSVVALAKMPDALRNLVQAVYTGASGVWVQHQGLGALVAPEEVTQAPTAAYALLSAVDVYAIWFLVLLFLGLVHAVGLERKRAAILVGGLTAFGLAFSVVPALVAGAFMPV